MTEISIPGAYSLLAADYHADPVAGGSLSSSGAKRLLPPSCPAKFRYWLTTEEHKPQYDLGKAAHALALSDVDAIERIVIVEAENWRTKEARGLQAEAYAAGQIPLLRKEYDTVEAMATELMEHPYAGDLIRSHGAVEQCLFWQDHGYRFMRRAMLDWVNADGTLIMDYKTTTSAHPDAIASAMWTYRYFQQGPWYQDGVTGAGLSIYPPDFVFIFQEKTPPYVVTPVIPDAAMLAAGRRLNLDAIEIYDRCRAFNHWPGYADEPITVGLPRYATRELENRE